jgi:VanZ family protein
MRALFRLTAWMLLLVIALLSFSPPTYRPATDVGHSLEHFLIFLVVGFALGLGYANRWRVVTPSLVAFAASIELVQLFVPGRHARVVDFVIDAGAGCVGIALSWICTQARRVGSRERS